VSRGPRRDGDRNVNKLKPDPPPSAKLPPSTSPVNRSNLDSPEARRGLGYREPATCQCSFFRGFARPTKMTMPSPPGLPVFDEASESKLGFQLLTAHTFPA
jgi:hypothetical protein